MSDSTPTNALGQREHQPVSRLDPPQKIATSRLALVTHSAGLILGFVAGFVDVAGYLALFGLFSANMTGNILLIAVELIQPRGDIALSRLVAVPLLMSGVLLGWLIAAQAKRRAWRVAPVLIASEAIALVLFAVIGTVYGSQVQSSQQSLIVAIGAFSLIAMGLQNALGRELSADMPATTVMTNNLSLLVLEGAAVVSARLGGQPLAANTATRQRFARIAPVFVGFVIGAMAGAFGMRHLGYLSIGLPIALLALLAVTRLKTDTASPRSSDLLRGVLEQ